MDISTENNRILPPPPTFPKKFTKNSSFSQKWRNLSYNKANKTQGDYHGIQTLWRNYPQIRQDRNMSLKEAAGDAITPNNLSRFEKGLATVKSKYIFLKF